MVFIIRRVTWNRTDRAFERLAGGRTRPGMPGPAGERGGSRVLGVPRTMQALAQAE